MTEDRTGADRRLIVRGVTWNTIYQVFEGAVAFVAMLVLVRVIPPADYGRAGAVVGVLGLLNAVGFGAFAAQALQLPEGEEPDWSLHCSAGLYLQAGLFSVCQGLAGLCWLAAEYRAVAPLLHLAALGFLLDWPAQLRMAMLRRAMDFRRLQILLAISNVTSLAVSFALGLAGGGAYALVLGANVTMPVPFAIDLWLVRRWRPRAGWWRWPGRQSYRPALVFGLQQAASTLISRGRGAMEAAVLPGAVGYVPIGLLNRARALFAITAGRPGNILGDTVYPLLPRYAGDPSRYARAATLFAQALLLVLVPGAIFIGMAGPSLSRLLYGDRWSAADPLIFPAALAGLGLGVSGIASSLLLAANRLRACVALEALGTLLAAPAIAVAVGGRGIVAYAWTSAAGHLLGAAAGLVAASVLLTPGWLRAVLVPPLASSLLAGGALLAARAWLHRPPAAPGLIVDAAVYLLALVAVLRAFFPGALATVLGQTPWTSFLQRWLCLPRTARVGASRPG